MSIEEIKIELHITIEQIEDRYLLQSVLTILSQRKHQRENYKLTADQLGLLKEREQGYLKGESQTQTFEEFRLKMNKKISL
jgi:hypothetical protein